MIIKYNNGKILAGNNFDKEDIYLINLPNNCFEKYKSYMENYQFSQAIIIIWDIIKKANAYIDLKAPWNLYKKDRNKLNDVLNVLSNTIYKVNILIQPILPIAAKKIFRQLNVDDNQKFGFISKELKVGSKINKPEGVFPRILIK